MEIIDVWYRDHYWRVVVRVEFCIVFKVDNSFFIVVLLVMTLEILVLLMVMVMMDMNLS